eukprot:264808-Pleurochrysis_carterae.AAC.2
MGATVNDEFRSCFFGRTSKPPGRCAPASPVQVALGNRYDSLDSASRETRKVSTLPGFAL